MNEFWNLKPLYEDFDDPKFSTDIARLEEAVAASSEPWYREHIYAKLNAKL